jgi:L-threonylcarbamoyladenylate synthase
VAHLTTGLPGAVEALAKRFWPGPLTLVLPRSAAVPDEVTSQLETVAIRVPAHPVARALLAAAAIPVAAPSANLFSRPSPTTAAHVLDDLGDRIDLVLDGGPTRVGVESTVLDLSGEVPMILRPGAVTREMLLEVLPRVDSRIAPMDDAEAKPSPGMLTRHYSPRAPLTLYAGSTQAICRRITADANAALALGQTVGIIAADYDPIAVGRIARFGPVDRPDIVAARLYSVLRELDSSGVDLILARQFPTDAGLGRAVRDRLSRAAAGGIIEC